MPCWLRRNEEAWLLIERLSPLSFFTVNSLQSPYKKLKEALSSVEAFERHYLVSQFLATAR